MRFSLVVRASDCQCTSCNGPGFDPSIRRHSGIWWAADEAVLKLYEKEKKIPRKKYLKTIQKIIILISGEAWWRLRHRGSWSGCQVCTLYSDVNLAIIIIVSDPNPHGSGFLGLDVNPEKQCCGSEIFIPDPGSWFLPIPDPGSRIPDPKTASKRGVEKNLFSYLIL